MEHVSSNLPWTYDQLREAAYRVSRRREALSMGLLEAVLVVGLVEGATCGGRPEYQPVLLWLAAVCLFQSVLFECLWPTRFARARTLIFGVASVIAIMVRRWPQVVPDVYLSIYILALTMIIASGVVLFSVAIINRWPIRRTAEQLAVDKWMASQRHDMMKAKLKTREDIIAIATKRGSVRMKRIGVYAIIGHGLMKLCDLAYIEDIRIEPTEPAESIETIKRIVVSYDCGRYEGKGKTTMQCLDRMQAWKEQLPARQGEHRPRKKTRVGYFRLFDADAADSWGLYGRDE